MTDSGGTNNLQLMIRMPAIKRLVKAQAFPTASGVVEINAVGQPSLVSFLRAP